MQPTKDTGTYRSGAYPSDLKASPGLLNEIASRLHLGETGSVPSVPVTGIACEPGEIRPGDLYVALRHRAPGSIAAAVGRGAVAVVSEATLAADPGVPVVIVQDEVRALGHLAARLFGKPARALRTWGITGSFGKSAASYLAAAGLEAAGLTSGVIDQARYVGPSPHRLQSRMRAMQDGGAAACVLEAGARDLVLGRFEGTTFDSAVFLGFRSRPQGFIDDDDECLDAMLDLFRALPTHAIAAVNRDDPCWELVAAETRARVVTFGTSGEADVRARVCGMDLGGASIDVRTPVGALALRTRLVGADHAANEVVAERDAQEALGYLWGGEIWGNICKHEHKGNGKNKHKIKYIKQHINNKQIHI